MSHFFYPVWYHALLGFANPEQFARNPLVTTIGFAGMMPTLLLFVSARNPVRNRDAILALIISSGLGCLTFSYLVWTGQFPAREIVNVCLFFATTILLSFFYFWTNQLKEANYVS